MENSKKNTKLIIAPLMHIFGISIFFFFVDLELTSVGVLLKLVSHAQNQMYCRFCAIHYVF